MACFRASSCLLVTELQMVPHVSRALQKPEFVAGGTKREQCSQAYLLPGPSLTLGLSLGLSLA